MFYSILREFSSRILTPWQKKVTFYTGKAGFPFYFGDFNETIANMYEA